MMRKKKCGERNRVKKNAPVVFFVCTSTIHCPVPVTLDREQDEG